MGENNYQSNRGSNPQYTPPQDWTPYSDVSSFNYQLTVDSSLNTPVSMPDTPVSHQQRAPMISRHRSPNHSSYAAPAMYLNTNVPIRSRAPENTANFSISPYFTFSPQSDPQPDPPPPPTPYFGSYSVSGPATSFSQPQQPRNHAPILSEPRPRHRNPSYSQPQNLYSQDAASHQPWSTSSQPLSQNYAYDYTDLTSSSSQSVDDASALSVGTPDEEDSYGDTTSEERLILRLRGEGLKWKEVAKKFTEETGLVKEVAALQMKVTRLKRRVRVHTADETSTTPKSSRSRTSGTSSRHT